MDPESERMRRRERLPPREERERLMFRDDQKLVIVVEHCTAPRPRDTTGLRGSSQKYVGVYTQLVDMVQQTCTPGQSEALEALENPALKRWPAVDRSVQLAWERSHLDRPSLTRPARTHFLNGYTLSASRLQIKPVPFEPGPWEGPRIGSFEIVFSVLADGKVSSRASGNRTIAPHRCAPRPDRSPLPA